MEIPNCKNIQPKFSGFVKHLVVTDKNSTNSIPHGFIGFLFLPDTCTANRIAQNIFFSGECNSAGQSNGWDDNFLLKCHILLIISNSVAELICDAARFQNMISIDKYSIEFPAAGSNGMESLFIVLEVHDCEVIFSPSYRMQTSQFSPENLRCGIAKEKDCNCVMSLNEFNQSFAVKEGNINGSFPRNKKNFSIKGMVTSISSIILVPKDPFALIELYETINDTFCVVVLKGVAALICHAGCHPGNTIIFHNVRRKKWHVPASIDRKKNYNGRNEFPFVVKQRIPSHVFVVDDAFSIEHQLITPRQKSMRKFTKRPFPNSIEANIVEYISPSQPTLGNHVYKIILTNESEKQIQYSMLLFLTHCPMSISISAGLRPGTKILLSNFHFVFTWGDSVAKFSRSNEKGVNVGSYVVDESKLKNEGSDAAFYKGIGRIIGLAACSRSSVTILNYASESNFEENGKKGVAKNHSKMHCKQCFLNNYKRTVSESVWRWSVLNWIIESGIFVMVELASKSEYKKEQRKKLMEIIDNIFCLCLENDCPKMKVGSKQKLVQTRRGNKEFFNTGYRDVYEEFFSHEVIFGRQNFLCVDNCSPIYNTSKVFPIIISLIDIVHKCLNYTKDKIERTLEKKLKSVGVEPCWNGSDVLPLSKLIPILFFNPIESTQSKHNVDFLLRSIMKNRFFTGGISETLADHHLSNTRLVAMKDGNCRVPVLHSYYQKDDNFSHGKRNNSCFQDGELICLPLDAGVVISFIYLGKVTKIMQKDSPSSTKAKITHLPPNSCKPFSGFERIGKNEIRGSCGIFLINGHWFVASVQLLFMEPTPTASCPKQQNFLSRVSSMNFKFSSDSSASVFNNKDDKEIHSKIENLCQHTSIRSTLGVGSSSLIAEGNENRHIMAFGKLVRHRFRYDKVINKCYRGLSLVLSHIPVKKNDRVSEINKNEQGKKSNDFLSNLSMVQTIEVKVAVAISSIEMSTMKAKLFSNASGFERVRNSESFPVNHSKSNSMQTNFLFHEHQISLACAWWSIVEGRTSSGLAIGGYDKSLEYVDRPPCTTKYIPFPPLLHVHVSVPLHLAENTNLGYVRWNICPINELKVGTCISVAIENDNVGSKFIQRSIEMDRFDMESNGKKVMPGSLDKSSPRKRWIKDSLIENSQSYVQGELLSVPSSIWIDSGVKSMTLESIFCEMYEDLKYKDPEECNERFLDKKLTPSLVRNVVGAYFMQLQFCRARVFCYKCSNYLSSVDHQTTVSSSLTTNNLFCPSGCSMLNAKVQWQCSGIIEGKTGGQGKLYAEGDAALALLGQGLNVSIIEDGAWRKSDGIIFNRFLPLSTCCKNAITKAQLKYQQSAHGDRERKRRRTKQVTLFDFLEVEYQAEYLLHKHCKYSKEPKRRLNYLCRCKPMPVVPASSPKKSGDKTSDHQNYVRLPKTIIEVMERMETKNVMRKRNVTDAAVYREISSLALPQLKLILIDCCIPVQSCSDITWNSLREIKELCEQLL